MTGDPIPTPFLEDYKPDQGHIGLMRDLNGLVREARNHSFHDKKGIVRYPLPKVALIGTLMLIIERTKKGYYNNHEI